MLSSDFKKYQLPDDPGVYFFKRGKEILYIGKATSLSDRVRSYFSKTLGETRGPKIEQMLKLANRLDWQQTDSVLEALLLESALIKKNQPPYNTREKDDKSYWLVLVTDEPWPRILLRRKRELLNSQSQTELKFKYQFGPFPHSAEIKAALKIIRQIFPYRDKCFPPMAGQKLLKPCFNQQLGLCPGVCLGQITARDYQRTIKNIYLLFVGKKQQVIKNLNTEMLRAIKIKNFEQAAKLRDQLFALQHVRDVALLKNQNYFTPSLRIEAYDVAHWQGQASVGAMAVWQEGELDRSQFRKFKLRGKASTKADDLAGLKEILTRRLDHLDWPQPNLIVVDGDQRQIKIARSLLLEKTKNDPRWAQTNVIGVVKNKQHRADHFLGDVEKYKTFLQIITEINEAAHLAAIAYHRYLLRSRT